jgi:nucleoside-diphosphate-sugar epimerase
MGSRILITGNRGYIGSVLTRMALDAGYEVKGLDSDLFEDCDFGSPPPACEQVVKDLRDVELSDVAGVDAVLHFAGLCNDPLGDLAPDLTMDINFRASLTVAKLAKKAGAKIFIMASSCSLYGASGDAMIDETAQFQPLTQYARSKAMVEEAVSALATRNFSPVFLRNATAYGVSPRLRLDLVLNDFVAAAHSTGVISIKSDGTPWRPIVHIEDIARSCLAVLEAPRPAVHNRAFNVGRNEENYQVRDLAEIVRDVIPGSRIEYSPGGGPDLRCYRVDFSRIARELPGFQPQWNAQRGAEELYEACRRNQLTAEDAQGPKYRRLARVRELSNQGSLADDLRRRRAAHAGTGSDRP